MVTTIVNSIRSAELCKTPYPVGIFTSVSCQSYTYATQNRNFLKPEQQKAVLTEEFMGNFFRHPFKEELNSRKFDKIM